jgi:uncharacterized membrane protein
MNKKRLEHRFFLLSISLKGIDSLLEIVGGVLILFLTPQSTNWLIRALTQRELSEDPHDLLANFLVHVAGNFSESFRNFAAFYLLSHGLIKIILIVSLWKKILWAYPTSMFVFAGFGIYQTYRYFVTHSIGLLMLTVLDIAVIYLIWAEYRKLRLKP